MQRMLLADALSPKTPARERAQAARAWKELEEQKRIMRFKPAPKAMTLDEHEKRQKQRKLGSLPDSPRFVETNDLRPPVTPAFTERPVRRLFAAGAGVNAGGNGSADSSDIPSEQHLGSEEDGG